MKVLLLAGGASSRLSPLTISLPKALLPINGKPLLYHIIQHCTKNYLTDFVLCTTPTLLPQFKSALSTIEGNGISVEYSESPDKYNNSGRILVAQKFVKNENFVLYYTDILTDLFLDDMKHQHVKNRAICTMGVCSEMPLELGVVESPGGISGAQKVTRFIERPRLAEISDVKANVGIAICSPKVFKYCKKDENFFGQTLPKMLKTRERIFSYETSWYLDIGSFTSLEKAQHLFTQT